MLLCHLRLLANTGHGSDVSLGRDALLNQVSVLIVENEPFIALDLATAVEEARGKVIGPAGSVREALMLIERHLVQAAVLDVNLSDRDVTPLLSFSLKAAFGGLLFRLGSTGRAPRALSLRVHIQKTHSACAALTRAGCADADVKWRRRYAGHGWPQAAVRNEVLEGNRAEPRRKKKAPPKRG